MTWMRVLVLSTVCILLLDVTGATMHDSNPPNKVSTRAPIRVHEPDLPFEFGGLNSTRVLIIVSASQRRP
ncbi:hypothetical protein FOA52_009599 [Chlamydomonas sp. UWO 241]|nr:hypothetical protein FOA52_009599 [Chlamydomonas sp. UWO 241]